MWRVVRLESPRVPTLTGVAEKKERGPATPARGMRVDARIDAVDQDRAQDPAGSRTGNRVQDRASERPQTQPQERPEARPQQRLQERARDLTQERAQDRPRSGPAESWSTDPAVDQDGDERPCAHCGRPVPQRNAAGRPFRYCRDNDGDCQRAARNARLRHRASPG
ncbi:hypothetical protein GCM10027610_045630 [Dactylosporangium cerinum]